ncbi:uncharacterized protein PG986_010165 [Apiospora aurea]|uniref:Uncharacterized protein n=1 Tax=Apiospora aurea TaxID=335848 RepID=A0ABR1Q9Q3_9PEZI
MDCVRASTAQSRSSSWVPMGPPKLVSPVIAGPSGSSTLGRSPPLVTRIASMMAKKGFRAQDAVPHTIRARGGGKVPIRGVTSGSRVQGRARRFEEGEMVAGDPGLLEVAPAFPIGSRQLGTKGVISQQVGAGPELLRRVTQRGGGGDQGGWFESVLLDSSQPQILFLRER